MIFFISSTDKSLAGMLITESFTSLAAICFPVSLKYNSLF